MIVGDIVSEATGLTRVELRERTGTGKTLAEIIEATGGDVTAVRADLVAAFGELPNAEEQDPEAMADRWLGWDE